MHFTKLVPTIFYKDILAGLKIFADFLEFTIWHNEPNAKHPFYVVEKDGLRINLFQDPEFAEKDHPEFRLVTTNIEEVYEKVKIAYPELLHPNLSQVMLRHWGAKNLP